MRKASLVGALVLLGILGLSLSAAAKDNDHHDRDRDRHHEMRELHDHDHAQGHLTAKQRRATWEKHERERRDHERAEWAKRHKHHPAGWDRAHPHPAQNAALRKPVPPAGTNHYHQYHPPVQAHVAPATSTQGK